MAKVYFNHGYVEDGLEKIVDETLRILNENNIPYYFPDRIVWNNRLKKTLGWYCYTKDIFGKIYRHKETKIEISTILKNLEEKELLNTMIHEFIHTCDDCQNHGKLWKKYAEKIYENNGIKIERCCDLETFEKLRTLNSPTYRYKVICKKCGKIIAYRKSQCKLIKYPEKYFHTGCKGELYVETI